MDLRAHGVDKVTARQNESLRTKLLAACVERNEAREEIDRLREMVAWMLASKGAYLFHEDECPWQYGADETCNCRVSIARAARSGKVGEGK